MSDSSHILYMYMHLYTEYGVMEMFSISSTVNVGEDCPVFDGMYEFCQLSAGGSIGQFMWVFGWVCGGDGVGGWMAVGVGGDRVGGCLGG